jgi:SAM-dependent methyltransferase
MPVWEFPFYELKDKKTGKPVFIDVTRSVSAGLKPPKFVTDELIPFFKSKRVTSVLDFGAGALRYTLPLLEAKFEVCIVEFEETFGKPNAKAARAKAEGLHNFTKLLWPKQFIDDDRKFDGAILSYVIQVMPKRDERELVISEIYKKLDAKKGLLFYSSRYGEITKNDAKFQAGDGYYRGNNQKPKKVAIIKSQSKTKGAKPISKKYHSFYKEFGTEETHKMFERVGFRRIRSLGERGNDQIFVYAKGKASWV